MADIVLILGSRIRQVRLDKGWRQIDLAHHTGISENYISDVETGKKEICIRNLKAISKALGVPLSALVADL